MADILIRMEMPHVGCVIAICANGDVIDTQDNILGHAIELPPHGDLIDRSYLLENSKVNGMYPHWIDTMDVKRAPVIVPAERRKPND